MSQVEGGMKVSAIPHRTIKCRLIRTQRLNWLVDIEASTTT